VLFFLQFFSISNFKKKSVYFINAASQLIRTNGTYFEHLARQISRFTETNANGVTIDLEQFMKNSIVNVTNVTKAIVKETMLCHDSVHDACRKSIALLTLAKMIYSRMNIGSFLVHIIPSLQQSLFKFYYLKTGMGPLYLNPKRFLTNPGLQMHHVGQHLVENIFAENNKENWKISLFELPLLVGRWPLIRLFRSLTTTARECLPYFLDSPVNASHVLKKGVYCFNICSQKVEKWLFSNRQGPYWNDTDVCNIPFRRINELVNSVQKLKDLIQVMLQTKHRAQGLEAPRNLLSPFKDLQLFTNINDTTHPSSIDFYSAVPLCEPSVDNPGPKRTYKGAPVFDNCLQFNPIPTDLGLCHAMNVDHSLRASAFQAALESSSYPTSNKVKGRVLQAGTQSFTFTVNRQTENRNLWRHDDTQKLRRGGFLYAVVDRVGAMAVRRKTKRLQLGHHVTLSLKLSVVRTNPDLKSLNPLKRGCIFPEEGEEKISLFSNYSQAACQMECMLAYARSVCGCTPWEYPSPNTFGKNQSLFLCDFLGHYCFNEVMKNTSHAEHNCSHCTADCDSITVKVDETSLPLDEEAECSYYGKRTWAFDYALKHVKNRIPLLAHHVLSYDEPVKRPKLMLFAQEVCKKMVREDFAVVTVQFERDTYIKSIHTHKVGFTEKISSIGKYLFG